MALNLSGLYNSSLSNSTLSNVAHISSPGEFFLAVKPLIIFVLAMAVYAIFIFKFYRFLARRDILKLKMHKYYEGFEGFLEKMGQSIGYVLENLIVIPLLVFFWFFILAAFILFLSESKNLDLVLLSAMAIVGAVRVTAYYNEDLSRDLAKMIPFALLGVFIIDMNYFSLSSSWDVAKQLPMFLDKLVFYLVFVVLVEFVMRILNSIVRSFKGKKDAEEHEGGISQA